MAPRRISKLLEVPLVVMGHSHVRRVSDLAGGPSTSTPVRLADVEETKAHHGGGTPDAVNTADLLVP